MSAPTSTARRLVGAMVLVVALGLGAGVAAADLTGVVSSGDRGGAGDHPDADATAAAVGEATRAGAGTATCPAVGDGEEGARLVVTPATDADSDVTVLRYGGEQATADEPQTVSPETPLVVELDPEEAAAPVGVRWRGEPVTASWLVDGPPAAAGPCEPYPQPRWQVVGFDTTLESDSTLHLVNPYTIDAVVRVTFGTPGGRSVLARTDNVMVGAGQHRALDVTDLEPEHPELGVTVETLAGRVMVQGETTFGTTSEEEGPEGRALLPAVPAAADRDEDAAGDEGDEEDAAVAEDAAAPQPLGATGARAGDDATSWLVVHNLEDREAAFRVRVTDPDEATSQLRGETGVPPGGVIRVDLDEIAAATEFGVAIEPVGDARLAATRLTAVTTSDGGQDISAAPLRPLTTRWALAGGEAGRGRLSVANLGGQATEVTVEAGKATPDDWSGVAVAPGEQATFELGDLDTDGAVPLRVAADDPVAVGLTRREGGEGLSLWSLGAVDTATWNADARSPARRDPALPGRLAPEVPTEDDDGVFAP